MVFLETIASKLQLNNNNVVRHVHFVLHPVFNVKIQLRSTSVAWVHGDKDSVFFISMGRHKLS